MNSVGQLQRLLDQMGCMSGSIHLCDGEDLRLLEQVGLPPEILAAIETIPKGKGMAGHAWATGAPATTCNIESDPDAPVEDAARNVGPVAAIAIPVKDTHGKVIGVVGFAYPESGAITEAQIIQCDRAARTLLGV